MKKLSLFRLVLLHLTALIFHLVSPVLIQAQTYKHIPLSGWDFNAGSAYSLVLSSSKPDTSTTNAHLHIVGERNSFGYIEIPSLNFKKDFHLNSAEPLSFLLPPSIVRHKNDDKGNNIINVVINNYGTVYGTVSSATSTETFLAIPQTSTGTEYIIPGTASSLSGSKIGIANFNSARVTVTILPSVDAGARKAKEAFRIYLDKNQTYELNSAGDLSGTRIITSRNVAVFSGASNYYENEEENSLNTSLSMVFPLHMQGYKYIASALIPGQNDKVRIFATEAPAKIKINGIEQPLTRKGWWIEKNFNDALIIESDTRIMVSHYATGLQNANPEVPPAVSNVPAFEQYHNHFAFYVPDVYSLNFLSVILPMEGLDSLFINEIPVNKSLFSQIGNSDYWTGNVHVQPGKHQLRSSVPVSASVFGYNNDAAYAFTAGLGIKPLMPVNSLHIAEKIYLRPGEIYCPTATINDGLSGIRLDFKILKPGGDFVSMFQYTSTGRATVEPSQCYTQTSKSNDTVITSMGNLLDTAFVYWSDEFPVFDRYYHDIRYKMHQLQGWVANEDGGGPNPPDFSSPEVRYINNHPDATIDRDLNIRGILELRQKVYIASSNINLGGLTGSGGFTIRPNLQINLSFTGSPALDTSYIQSLNPQRIASITLRDIGYTTPLKLKSAITLLRYVEIERNQTLVSDGQLTLISPGSRIYPVEQGGRIIGDVIVHRHISPFPQRKWVFISSPVLGNQSIHDSWQEKLLYPSGFGTKITGGSAAEGFDTSIPGADYSLKFYNSETQKLDNVLNTFTTPVSMRPYFLFSRGSTTLRSKGEIFIGSKTVSVQKNGFTAIPNPYPSSIFFNRLEFNEVVNGFYFWNSRISGAYGLGGYVVVSRNQYGVYEYVPDFPFLGRNSQAIISSGESFLVKATANAVNPSISFREQVKETRLGEPPRLQAFPDISAMPADQHQFYKIRVNLLSADTIENEEYSPLIDGVMVSYDKHYSNTIDDMDMEKPENFGENLSIAKNNRQFMIERKSLVQQTDTVKLNISNMQKGAYRLQIVPENLVNKNMSVIIEDQFRRFKKELSSLEENTEIPIQITDDPRSFARNRFSLIISKRQMSNSEKTKRISVFPNPMKGKEFTLQLRMIPEGIYTIDIINSLGQVIHQQQFDHTGGNSDQQIVVKRMLSKGIYQVQLRGDNMQETIKIICN